ncbi:hypothetical protein VN12_14275 [Pirellula sp. SH-Sr6A]|nr:hypothetical protein VN12_14275 [Pirellula sp. SH-Sr6A]
MIVRVPSLERLGYCMPSLSGLRVQRLWASLSCIFLLARDSLFLPGTEGGKATVLVQEFDMGEAYAAK